jgi:hypothetical protein
MTVVSWCLGRAAGLPRRRYRRVEVERDLEV